MGFRPGEWEQLTPAEVRAFGKAQETRRRRDMQALAIAACLIANRIPLNEQGVDVEDVEDVLNLPARAEE